MKKEYLYLIIAGIVIYIISQNRKDEENNRQIGGGYISYPKWINTDETVTAKAPDPEKRKEAYEVHKPSKAGEGLIL